MIANTVKDDVQLYPWHDHSPLSNCRGLIDRGLITSSKIANLGDGDKSK